MLGKTCGGGGGECGFPLIARRGESSRHHLQQGSEANLNCPSDHEQQLYVEHIARLAREQEPHLTEAEYGR